ncbi:MAG: S-layer homology domain-containing protein [Oscillibacter sp.]
MKKWSLVLTACLLASAAVVFAFAAGGDSGDPLASLSYLNGAYTGVVESKLEEKLNASDAALLKNAEGGVLPAGSNAATWTETRLKAGDQLLGSTGTNVMVLAGGVEVNFPAGAVIDVSAGAAIASGTALVSNHRYLVAEDTSAAFSVTSKTAVVDYQGGYQFALSSETDYNAIAAALKQLRLFKGSTTGYGQSFDLELAPTRVQALIMFIRVLGEEEAALAYTGGTHFTDIAKGSQSEKYVGYAVSRGYTNGCSPTQFKPNVAVTVNQYMEFMLRALGYSSTANTNLSGSLTTALTNGIITSGEQAMLQADPFLRADLAYISYYGLDASLAGSSKTLRDTLIEKNMFTPEESAAAAALITGPRK